MNKLQLFFASRKSWTLPYLIFSVIFVIIPLLLIVVYAFTDDGGHLTLDNFRKFFDHPEAMNGETYIACLFPEGLESVKYVPMAQETAGGIGHEAGFCDYEPGRPFVYYFGSAWSKYDVPDFSVWKTLLGRYLHRLEVPLNVSMRE